MQLNNFKNKFLFLKTSRLNIVNSKEALVFFLSIFLIHSITLNSLVKCAEENLNKNEQQQHKENLILEPEKSEHEIKINDQQDTTITTTTFATTLSSAEPVIETATILKEASNNLETLETSTALNSNNHNIKNENDAQTNAANLATEQSTQLLPSITPDSVDTRILTPLEKTVDEKNSEEIYDEETLNEYLIGMSKLNATSTSSQEDNKEELTEAYVHLSKAAVKGHAKAREEMAVAMLFGHYVQRNLTAAKEIFQDLSQNRGYPRSQFFLGFMYASGLSVKSSQAKALTYFTFAALGGNKYAQMAMGYRYYSSINVAGNCEIALSYYRKVATEVASRIKTNSVGTLVHRVRLYDEEEKVTSQSQIMLDDDLVQYYQLLADRGDIQAQYGLGLLHYQGARGLHIQYDKALHYFSKAAEAGNNYAMAYLGKLYLEGGQYVKQDNATAIRYFRMAADKGNPIGQAGLGIVYLYGSGIERDFSKAMMYFQLSADQNYVEGHFLLGIMHYHGYGTKKDFKLAVKHFNLASQLGHVLGYFNLAQMHATGTGVLRSCTTATELYKSVAERGTSSQLFMEAHAAYKENDFDKALIKYIFLAELGYEVAQSNVAYILDQYPSKLFSQNDSHRRALVNWNRAASQGYHIARIKLGDYYYYGKGTHVDYQQAASHYKYASEISHNPQAMFNLAYMHENGLGLRKDMHLAKRFYDMASETSGEAHVPVALALFKLNLLFYIENFLKNYFNENYVVNPSYYFGNSWDIYLMALLAGIISFIYLYRRRV